MRWLVWTLVAIGVIAALASAYVRLAPVEPADWHKEAFPKAPGDYPSAGSFEAVRRIDDPAALVALDTAIRATPRTRVIAGSMAEGLVTYETRSRIMGFPDYTTVTLRGEDVSILGRLRFGSSDMGVNRARIEGWLTKVAGFSGP